MKKTSIISSIIVLLSAGSIFSSNSVIANTDTKKGSAPGVYVTPTTGGKYDLVSVDWTSPQSTDGTYWAVHNWNQGGEGGGYAGFQQKTRNGASLRTLHFAIWDPISVSQPIVAEYLSANSVAGRFGGEGTGLNVSTTYPWENGSWYTMTMRSWSEDGHSKFGQWVKDIKNNKWLQVAILDFPVNNVGFNYGEMMFQEDFLGHEENMRSGQLKNSFARSVDTKDWNSLSRQKVENQHKNDQNWNGGATDDHFWFQAGGYVNSDIGSGGTFSIKQPNQPKIEASKINDFKVNSKDGTVNASWLIDENSLPQFSAKLTVYDQDTGEIVFTKDNIKSYENKVNGQGNLDKNSRYTAVLEMTNIYDEYSANAVSVDVN